jgi:hypothetical protein
MKKLFFKPNKPVDIADIKTSLEKKFPHYQYSLFGLIGKGLKVKKGMFRGVRIATGFGRIIVAKRPPTFLGAVLDRIFLGIPSAGHNKIAIEIVTFLEEKYK